MAQLYKMAEETCSFKATLYRDGSSEKNEVRRFVLPKNALTDFLFLEKKLKTVFQLLQSLPFSVVWEDSEGDDVLISSDEELKIAINEMKGEVYRLKIEVKSASGLKDENAEVRMAEETSSFQATLYRDGSSEKNEVRCFVLPKNASTDFLLLEKKLKTVFQSLQSLPFSVAWEDREGEEVLISSDEELKFAINKMKGEVYRLKIEVKSASGLKDENAVVHSGVHCDGCGGEVKGFRYKCIQCPNYDLCSACEMKCLHKEHYMIRLPQPIAFPQVLQYMFRNAWDSNDDLSSAQDFGAEGAAAPPKNKSERKDVDKSSQDKDDSRLKYPKTTGEMVATLLDPLARMAEETYSFKATWYLEGSSGKKEVRRFHLPKNASTDFHLLEKKLKTVFQSLQSLPFSVAWEDSEGDEVLISSDEELKTAINEMKGEVYRLKIEVKSASDLKDEDAEVHPRVHCDGCGGEVKGFRYKCIQCPNYDSSSAQDFGAEGAPPQNESERKDVDKSSQDKDDRILKYLKTIAEMVATLLDRLARMAEETSTFQATLYLEGSSGKKEVRRFVLPKNASTNYLLLEEKLKTVFQSLQSLPFSVTWEASEGEEVLISSDEELKIAINEMKGEVYRLKIELKSASGLKDENAEVNKTEEEVVLARKEVVEEESYHRNTQPLHFHERTGDNIVLSNNKRTAARKDYEATYYGGSVITNRPLKDNELFEVQLEKIIDGWGNDFSLGVTVANPTTVSFKSHWTNFRNGVWVYHSHSIWNNGKEIQSGYGIYLETLKVGDRVGVKRKSNGSLHFFVNGADHGAIETTIPETVYGVMDLYGNQVQATIVKP